MSEMPCLLYCRLTAVITCYGTRVSVRDAVYI